MRLLPYGPTAVLAEYDSLDEVIGATRAVHDRELEGIIDVVPAARTVLVVHEPGMPRASLDEVLSGPHRADHRQGLLVTIDVTYDGDDLDEIAAACHLDVAGVIAAHSGAEYTVVFCGFMPGFAYLLGLPSELHLPRRATPRPRVPAGSVAMASAFTGIYPAVSPGGWHLLGRTDAPLWDEGRAEPALLTPGMRVRFRPA